MSQTLTVQESDGISVVAIPDGSMLDADTIQEVGKRLFELVEKDGRGKLVLDFSEIRFMSSQALGVLLTLRRKAERSGAKIVLAGINDKLLRVFEITNLDKMFTFCANRDDGVLHLGGAPAGGA